LTKKAAGIRNRTFFRYNSKLRWTIAVKRREGRAVKPSLTKRPGREGTKKRRSIENFAAYWDGV